MARDEEGTLRVLSGHRVIIDGLIATFSGRIVGTAGDSVLAEFGSSVDAVRCAVEIQAALATRNNSLSETDRLLFRIGINLGDVIVEGDDILGDGVNVAAARTPSQTTASAPASAPELTAPAARPSEPPSVGDDARPRPVQQAPAAAPAPRVFTGGTATGVCEGDDQLTGEGTVRVVGSDLVVSFPPAAARRAPVVARGQLRDDGGLTLQVVRGGRGRGGAGRSFSGRLVDGRGTLTGPAGRCTVALQLN